MIVFKKIRYKNFLSTGNTFTEINLDQAHTTLIVGDSGSGKSTIQDSISFALYGKAFRPINKNQVINSINGSDCLVEIEFQIGNNYYLIRRGIKPTIFEIFCNDVLLNQDSNSRDYQEYLEKNILSLPFNVFSHIVVLGAVNFTPFMQLKPQERRLLIEDLLDIQIFSKMAAILKEMVSENKSALANNSSAIDLHKEKIRLYENYLTELKKDKQKQIENNTLKLTDLSSDISKSKEVLKETQSQIKILSEQITDEKTIISKLQKYRDYQRDIQNNISRLKKDLSFYEKNKECPTCHREFDDSYVEKMTGESKNKLKDLQLGADKIVPHIQKTNERYTQIQKVLEDISLLRKTLNEREAKISSWTDYKNRLEKDNKEILEKQNNNIKQTEQIEELNLKLVKLEKVKEQLINGKAIFELAAGLLKDGGAKAQIIKQYLPVINNLVNRFLNYMNFFVTFSIDENFDETIKNRGRDKYTYMCLSEGERQRLDIAVLLTWRTIATMKNSIRTNLLFIDELLDSSLDPAATENVIELIKTEPILKGTNIFVISHKTNMIDKFENILKFEKHNSFSQLIP